MTQLEQLRTAGMKMSRDFIYLLRDNGIEVPEHFRVALDQKSKTLVETVYQARTEEVVEIAEGIEEYIAVKDNDSHRYQIPVSKKDDWDTFCEIPSDDEASWDVPEWAERIDGMPVRSYKESLLATLKDTKISNE